MSILREWSLDFEKIPREIALKHHGLAQRHNDLVYDVTVKETVNCSKTGYAVHDTCVFIMKWLYLAT